METDIVPDTADSSDEMEEIADFDIVADEFDYEVTMKRPVKKSLWTNLK